MSERVIDLYFFIGFFKQVCDQRCTLYYLWMGCNMQKNKQYNIHKVGQ